MAYRVSFESKYGKEVAEFFDLGSAEDFIKGMVSTIIEDGSIKRDSMDYLSMQVAKRMDHIYEDGSRVEFSVIKEETKDA